MASSSTLFKSPTQNQGQIVILDEITYSNSNRTFEKMYITHIKQRHASPCKDDTPEMIEKVVNSQYQVAKAILAHPEAIVVAEGHYENQTSHQVDPVWKAMAKMVFPSGLPDTFSSLNELQKEFLFDVHAPRMLLCLGKITHLYKTQNEQECKLVEEAFDRRDPTLDLFEARERRAIFWAKQAVLESGNENVLLVFGALHDFQKRIALLNDPAIIFRENIDTTEFYIWKFLFDQISNYDKPCILLNGKNVAIPDLSQSIDGEIKYIGSAPRVDHEVKGAAALTVHGLYSIDNKLSPQTFEERFENMLHNTIGQKKIDDALYLARIQAAINISKNHALTEEQRLLKLGDMRLVIILRGLPPILADAIGIFLEIEKGGQEYRNYCSSNRSPALGKDYTCKMILKKMA